MNGTTILPKNGVPLSKFPDNPRGISNFSIFQPKVEGDFKHNYVAPRVIPRATIDQIGMYMGTGWMSLPCDNVNRNKIVKLGTIGLGFNEPVKTGVPVSWKQAGIFQATDRIGNLGADLKQGAFLISQQTY
jgi:hypothetical protein